MGVEFTEKFIRDQTYSEYFDRGMEYYHQGRIRDFVESGDLITAIVVGSHNYKAKIDLSTLDYECDCPAYRGDQLCKHLVAVLLTKINGITVKVYKNKSQSKVKSLAVKRRNGIFEPHELKQKIKTMLNSLDRYWGDYWASVDQQQRIFDMVVNEVNKLEDSLIISKELLDTAVWLDKELENYDDSDGIIQDTIVEIISKSVRVLEKSKSASDLSLFYKYNFDSDLVRIIFEEIENPLIVNALGAKVEKYSDRHELVYWAGYLKKHDLVRFEVLAKKHYVQNIELTALLMEYYLEKEKFDEVITIGWTQRHNFMLDELLVPALEKTQDIEKLIQYYEEKSTDHLNKEALGKLKKIYFNANQKNKWKKYGLDLLSRPLDNFEKLDLLMMLKRYVEAAKVLGKIDWWPGHDETLIYANKLALLDKQAGIAIYRILLEREAQKMVKSNFYPKLLLYRDKLLELNDLVHIQEFVRQIREKYPTKKRLQELL